MGAARARLDSLRFDAERMPRAASCRDSAEASWRRARIRSARFPSCARPGLFSGLRSDIEALRPARASARRAAEQSERRGMERARRGGGGSIAASAQPLLSDALDVGAVSSSRGGDRLSRSGRQLDRRAGPRHVHADDDARIRGVRLGEAAPSPSGEPTTNDRHGSAAPSSSSRARLPGGELPLLDSRGTARSRGR